MILKSQFGRYRPSIILTKCLDWNYWEGASILYELLNDLPESFECKLLALKQSQQTGTGSDTPQKDGPSPISTQPIFNCACSVLQQCSDIKQRAKILLKLFKFWKYNTLSIRTIEGFIDSNMEIVAEPLSMLLEGSPDNRPWLLDFPSQVYLRVTRFSLQRFIHHHEKEMKALEDRLCVGIKKNLEKEIELSHRIVISGNQNQASMSKIPAPKPAAITELESWNLTKSPTIAFSCNHVYPRGYFLDTLLPEFYSRYAAVTPGTPLTIKAIMEDYKLPFTNLACPKCLYNAHVKQIQMEKSSTSFTLWDYDYGTS